MPLANCREEERAGQGLLPSEHLPLWTAFAQEEATMSFKPESIGPVLEETARVARAAFPKGNLCLRLN
jgi:hypothetical protein